MLPDLLDKQRRVRATQRFSFRLATVCFYPLLLALPAEAGELLFDGDFESGTLAGWNPEGSGSAIVTRYGSCFSDHDTRALSIRGRYAGLLRNRGDSTAGGAMLTSKPFIAGRGIQFLALSEHRQSHDPVLPLRALEITILDQADKPLARFELSTAVASLTPGCPSSRADYSFSRHFLGTQSWLGKKIKLRFAQHPETARLGGFTLIDQVENIQPGSAPIVSTPMAEAGFAVDISTGEAYLFARIADALPANPDQLQYSWLINGEARERPYINPCLDELPPGDYTANLYIRRSGALLASDTLEFSFPKATRSSKAVGSSAAPVCNRATAAQ